MSWISIDRLGPGPVVAAIVILSLLFQYVSKTPRAKPPSLKDTIPYMSNTTQYLTDAGSFIKRVTARLHETNSNIVKFYVGWTPMYIVTGPKNVQTVLGSPDVLDGNFLQLMIMDKHWGMSRDEIKRFSDDKTGRSKTPAPGAEGAPEEHRYWLGHDRLYADFLAKREYSDALATSFYNIFSEQLAKYPKGEWATVRVHDMLKTSMAESAIISLYGSSIIELNPGFVEDYWKFDQVAGNLIWGLPKFLQRGPIAIKDHAHAQVRKHIDSAWDKFDWDGVDSESKWEPHFGSRLSRECAKWLRSKGFSNHAAAGHTLASLFGLNGNTIPLTTWAMIEAVKDPQLFEALRVEALSAYDVDSITGEKTMDAQRLVSLPLMQSFYVELMRLHVSFNATRQAREPIIIDGYEIEKGALVQTCSRIAHLEESAWSADDHPATAFWAYRHIQYTDVVDETSGKTERKAKFTMKARPSSFFPYGGGYVMCPGRHFAKQEILLAVAAIVSRFEVECLGWVNGDGSDSDRAGEDDARFAAFVAMHPDRELKVRWRRLW